MSLEEDKTQPLDSPVLEESRNGASNHRSAYVNQTIQTGTLPSTGLGASTDGTKFLAPEIDVAAHALINTAFPAPTAVAHAPIYHKPVMSQSETAMFDEGTLFPESNPVEPSKSAYANSSSQSTSKSVDNLNENLENAQNSSSDALKDGNVDSSETKTSRSNSVSKVTFSDAPQVVKAPKLDSDSLNMDDTDESDGEGEERGVKKSNGIHELNDNDTSLEDEGTEKALANLQADINKSYDEEEAEIASRQKAPARSSRGRRKPSASQGVAYDYYGTGTLHNDSEDEDGGWGSDDEVHATQTLMAPKLNFGSDDEKEAVDNARKRLDEESDDDLMEKEAPQKKKQRIVPYESSDDEKDNGQLEYGDMEVDEPDSKDKKHGNLEVSLIEDEEESSTVSRPRPSLGNVGRSTPVSKSKMSSSQTKATSKTESASSKATKGKAENSMDVSDSGDEQEGNSKQQTPSKSNVKSTSNSSKASTAHESPTPSQSKSKLGNVTPGHKTATKDTSISQSSKNSLSQSSTSQGKSQKLESSSSKKSRLTEHNDEDFEEEFEEEAPSRPKRTREAMRSPQKSAKSRTADKMPSEEIARLLRINAKESIAKYLVEEADDMEDYFTQRSLDMARTEAVEPPANLLKNHQFIVTGLRSSGSNSASSASWIKLQIKALGGKLVNARSANRLNRSKLNARKRSLPADRQDSVYLPQCILISEKPQRTLKYVNALVNSVPCVHYRWFLASLHFGKLLPLEGFMLPAGYNEDAALISQPDWMAQEDIDDVPGNEVTPFWTPDASTDPIIINSINLANESTVRKATNARVHGNAKGSASKAKLKLKRGPDNYRVQIIGIPSFQAQWKSILTQAGAKIVDRLYQTADYGRIDFVLSDSEPTDLSIQQATDRGLQLCTIDWALQSIIQRKVQDPKSKPAYTLNIEEWN